MPWWIPIAAGLQDSVGPCILLSVAVFLFMHLWCTSKGLVLPFISVCFIVVFIIVSVALDAGVFFDFFWLKPVVHALKISNLVIAALALLAGAVFFYEWYLVKRFKKGSVIVGRLLGCPDNKVKHNKILIYFVAVVLAVLMGVISSVWPPNYYITMISNNVFLPGQFWKSLVLLSVYSAVELWLMMLLANLISSKTISRDFKLIISSAFFLSAGIVVFYVF